MFEKTFIMVKHDGVQRGLVGEIISRFEKVGLKLIALKMLTPTEDLANRHYVLTEAWIEKLGTNTRKAFEKRGIKVKETNEQIATRVHGWLKDYLREGPVVAMAFEGYHAIEIGRKIVGPAEAKSAPLGTIRGDFTVDSYDMADHFQRPVRNLIHASGNTEEADNEINVWFSKDEICDYKKHDWNLMYKHEKK